MNYLGLYFGNKIISGSETKGKNLVNSFFIPRALLSAPDGEEKVVEEKKLQVALKDELSKHRIGAKEAMITLSGKDLIIRTFTLPALPREELASAVNFEVKKYIPFKLDEIVSDFQISFEKSIKKNLVLFSAIKKETLASYLSIFRNLQIKVNLIEYSAFSLVRFLELSKMKEKGVVGYVTADFQDEQEVNFTVLENGFPVFSRDISLSVGQESDGGPGVTKASSELTEKLRTEIRISIDYFHRKFLNKELKKVFFLCSDSYKQGLESAIRENSLIAQGINLADLLQGQTVPKNLSSSKSFACSLQRTVKTKIKMNLLTASERLVPKERMALPDLATLTESIKIKPAVAIVGFLICFAAFAGAKLQSNPLKQELKSVIYARREVGTIDQDATVEKLTKISLETKKKIQEIKEHFGERVFLTELLDTLPRVIPEGVWLNDISFISTERENSLTLDAVVYITAREKELSAINLFLSNLKQNRVFSNYFKEIDIDQVAQTKLFDVEATKFSIVCRSSR